MARAQVRADRPVKHLVGQARVLVATDNVDDAKLLIRQLESDFNHVVASTEADKSVHDFEEYRPDVLVLAFDGLDKAQGYCTGLYRRSQIQHPHRTVILCNKEDVRDVFELCKKQHFDDYVLYWPHTYDGSRLTMCIWNAARELAAQNARAEAPRPAALLAHARDLHAFEKLLVQGLADGEQRIAAARDSLEGGRQEIVDAIDSFAQRLMTHASRAPGQEDHRTLLHEIDSLKREQLEQARRKGARAVEPIGDWATRFRGQIEPAMAGTRALAELAETVRPIVMVVDDDSVARTLVGRMLDSKSYDVRFADDATEALAQLRRGRPDVILMDVRLPGLDGVTMTKRMKRSAHLADIPVIIMTGDARRETLESSMAAGAASFIVKPFSLAALGAKLEQVLPRRQAAASCAMSLANGSTRDSSRSSVCTATGFVR